MVPKSKPVNNESPVFGSFCERFVAERKRLGWSQTDLRTRMGVGKSTQINYESGESSPNADYLAGLDDLGFDVMYLLTGLRRAGGLSDEHQNLLDAYIAADESTRLAVFGVLTARYSDDPQRARSAPGWFRHEVLGEEDVRYQNPPIPARVLMEPIVPGGLDEPRRAGAQKRDED